MTPDDPWDDVLSQVEHALRELHLDSDATRDALLSGVREALGGIEDMLDPLEEPQVEVSVVPGGREADAPPSEGERPELKVAPAVEPSEDDPSLDEPMAHRQVRVVHLGTTHPPQTNSASTSPLGQIRLSADDAERWQTVFRGTEPQTYRVACTQGSLQLALDGELADQVEAGQTIDVQAALIRVSAREASTGSYWLS